jgi:hypothetical protein
MSAVEKEYQTCLPPEAYMRICNKVGNQGTPRFKSSVYPNPKPKPTKNEKETTNRRSPIETPK